MFLSCCQPALNRPEAARPRSIAILVFVVGIVWPTGCFRVVVALVLTASLVVPAGSVAAQGGFSDLDEAGSHRAGVEELAEIGVLEGTLCARGGVLPRRAAGALGDGGVAGPGPRQHRSCWV